MTLLEIGSQTSLGKIGSYWIGVVTNLKGSDLIRRKKQRHRDIHIEKTEAEIRVIQL